MKNHRYNLGALFLVVAISLGIVFIIDLQFPVGIEEYIKSPFYNQFGPLAITVELLVSAYYLLIRHTKTNFAFALFAFTALLDPIFNLTGIFTSLVPIYATVIFVLSALIGVWVAFTDAFDTGRISIIEVIGSFMLGVAVELFFNGMFS